MRVHIRKNRSTQSGFTLVELLISLVLTSFLFSSMLVVFQAQTRVNTVEMDVSESQQNARVAMSALNQDVRQAGYFVDRFNKQPVWIDAAPYQLTFNANISDQFVAMHRDSAVPLSDGYAYRPGDYSAPPQEENLPSFLDRYLNDSETIRLTLDRTHDGLVTTDDRQEGSFNPCLYTLIKEINGNPPAILAYNVRGPGAYPDGTSPPPLLKYWGTFFGIEDSLSLWGDGNGDGFLSPSEIAAFTRVSVDQLPNIRQVDVEIIVETGRPDSRYTGRGSTEATPYPYRSYNLRGRIRARNVGINPTGLLLCGNPPLSPLNPRGYDTPYDRGASITIEWDSSPEEYSGEDDVQYYSIYRKLTGGDYQVVGQVQAMGVDTSYTFYDDGDIDNFDAPVDGVEYYYYITSWDCAPQESVPSETIGPLVSVPNGPGPAAIEDAWDTPCDSGTDITVKISQSPQDDGSESGVSRYNFYRGTVQDTSIVMKIMIDTLAAAGSSIYEFHDTSGNMAGVPPVDSQPYYYIVRAVQGGVESENSNEFGPVWSNSGLSAPFLLSVSDKPADDGSALILEWRRSASEDCSPAPNEYSIQRRVKGTSTWYPVIDIPVAYQNYYGYEDDNGGVGLVKDTTYEYVVEIRTTGTGQPSNIVEGTPKENPPVGAPVNLNAQDVLCESDGDIEITWYRSPDDGAGGYTADEYHLYRKIDGGIYSQIEIFPAVGALSYSWVDADSTNPGNAPVVGNVYWYKVTAYDLDTGSESEPSNEDDALSDGSPGAPEITAAYDTYGGGDRQIRVEFTRSPDDGGCSDSVTQYRIYRTTTPGSYGAWIGQVSAIDANSYTWNDNRDNSSAPPLDGYSYYYVVRAYDPFNIVESRNSNEFGPVEPYGATCDCCPIFVDDMEIGDLGWSHGADPSYKDDWELGSPMGKSFDPSLANSGAIVWGTDLGGGTRDGQYRSSVVSWLITPTIDFSGFEAGYITMSYYRWLSVEDSKRDKAQIRLNDGSGWQTIWQNTQNDDTVDNIWKLQYLDLSQYVLGKSAVQIAFLLDTNSSQQYGGWNIDDVDICYTAPGPCDYFLYVGDSIAENQGNNLFFDITNGADQYVDLQGMVIGWSAENSRLKSISQSGVVWTASVAELPTVEAIFEPSDYVQFAPGETKSFKLRFQPGQMRGSALTLKFLTACGWSSEVVIQVPE